MVIPSAPYHVGYVVPDIERAMHDLGRAVGVEWNPVCDGRLGDWSYRIVFSRSGPLYTELIEGPAGSPWDPGEGPRCDHVGFWAGGIDACSRRLFEKGFPLDFDARSYGRPWAYHRMPGLGLRIELVDISIQPEFLRTWNPGGATMPPLNC
ncbi:VOC family protein [Nonomuraea purpurea]|uniref:VOC family protein n=1 Tax=Nonomuraea purpurea TaxID=1849276 RepID=A0ABV8GQV8_9ACTN